MELIVGRVYRSMMTDNLYKILAEVDVEGSVLAKRVKGRALVGIETLIKSEVLINDVPELLQAFYGD